MDKRQDAWKRAGTFFLIIISAIMLSLGSACQPVLAPPGSAPTLSAEAGTPGPAPTNKPTITPAIPAATATSPLAPTPDCSQTAGELVEDRFFSEQLDADIPVLLYLPPCYDEASQDGFPVVYLLHGLSYTNDQWLRLGLTESMDALIARGEIPPFIIVLPKEARVEPPQVSSFPEILTQDLIPWVDSHYATRPEKAYRGIGGLSRGAAWAVKIGFDHPELFCSIGAHSLPLFQADGGWINYWLTQTPKEEFPRVLIDIGRDDREWSTAQNFADQLDAAHVPHEWYLFKNGHTEDYWASHLDFYLAWYAKNW